MDRHQSIIVHPRYNPALTDHDIALMRLERAPSARFSVVTLLSKTDEERYNPVKALTVIGWGLTQTGGEASRPCARSICAFRTVCAPGPLITICG